MDSNKLESAQEVEAKLRKQARRIINKKHAEAIKRPTHLFLHEKNLTAIVRFSYLLYLPHSYSK